MWGERWGVVDEDGRKVIEHPLTGEVLLWPRHTKRGEAAARQAARELNLILQAQRNAKQREGDMT